MEVEESIIPIGDLPIELPRPDDEFELNVTEKLQLSDSDNDEQELRISPEKTIANAAELEEDDVQPMGGLLRFSSSDSDSNAPVANRKPNMSIKKRVNKLVDSDDDSDEPSSKSTGQILSQSQQSVEKDGEDGEVGKLMVSESENDDQKMSPAKKIHKLMSKIVDSESSSSSEAEPYQPSDSDGQPRKVVEVKKIKKLRKTSKTKKANGGPTEGSEMRNKLSALCDQSSDDEDYRVPEGEGEVRPSSKPSTERPPQRMSAKEAEEQMKVIQSESQRLAREATLTVPYHRPKQHSLKEFLNRHNVIRPVAQLDAPKAAAAIRMNKEQLEEYAKTLDERAKESQLFFKSESEDEPEADIELPNSIEVSTELILPKEDLGETATTDVVPEPIEIDTAIPSLEYETNTQTEENVNSKQSIPFDTIPNVSETIENQPGSSNLDKPSNLPSSISIDYDFGDEKTTSHAPQSKLELLKERIQAQVEPNSSPSLRGSSNTIIDLNTGDVLPGKNAGRDELFERFLKHKTKPAKKQPRDLSLLSTDNGIVTMHNVVLSLVDDEPDEVIQDSKPRSAFHKLKEALGTKLAQKRRDEIMKRKADAEVTHKKNKALDDDEEEEEDQEDGETENESEEGEQVDGTNTENTENDKPAESPSINIDDEEEEIMGCDEDADDNVEQLNSEDEEADSDEQENDVDDATTGKELRRRIVIQSDSDEEVARTVEPIITNTQRQRTLQEVDDLLDICADTNSFILAPIATITNRVPPVAELCMDRMDEDVVSESQLGDLCSGRFFTQAPLTIPASEEDAGTTQLERETQLAPTSTSETTVTGFRLDSSDDEDGETAISAKAKPKKRKAIQLTDDEDDDVGENRAPAAVESDDEESEAEDEESEEEPADDEDVVIDYDSEENEIEVVQTKKDRQKKASEFLEKEAELSESEWGSDDEDERNLDKLDIELGDADEFDDNQLHSELERIHMRRMRDADAREVKIIKDLLIEDEEEAGAERERQFKWKNVNDGNWADDAKQLDDGGETGMRDSDDENEEAWRKMRHERELLLKDKDKLTELTLADTTIPSPLQLSTTNADVTTVTRRRITIVKSAANTPPVNAKTESPFLISRSNVLQVTRNSFLGRDEQTLARLAALSKPEVEGAMSGVAKSGGNFVFSTLSPAVDPEKEKRAAKRKSDTADKPSAKKSKLIKATADQTGVKKKRLLDSLT